jgi:hypothetical protein
MMRVTTAAGSGTNQSRNNRGKDCLAKARVPKQVTTDAIHHATNASISMDNLASFVNMPARHPAAPVIPTNAASESKHKPARMLGLVPPGFFFQSRIIRLTLIGMMRRMWVYASFVSAKVNVATRKRHQINTETTTMIANILLCTVNFTGFSYAAATRR